MKSKQINPTSIVKIQKQTYMHQWIFAQLKKEKIYSLS